MSCRVTTCGQPSRGSGGKNGRMCTAGEWKRSRWSPATVPRSAITRECSAVSLAGRRRPAGRQPTWSGSHAGLGSPGAPYAIAASSGSTRGRVVSRRYVYWPMPVANRSPDMPQASIPSRNLSVARLDRDRRLVQNGPRERPCQSPPGGPDKAKQLDMLVYALHESLPRERIRALPRPRRKTVPGIWRHRGEVAHRRGKGMRVVSSKESGQAVDHALAGTSPIRGHHGLSTRHRLERHQAPVFVRGRKNSGMAALIQVQQVCVGGRVDEEDVVAAFSVDAHLLEVGSALRIDHARHEEAKWVVVGRGLEDLPRVNRQLDVLLPHDPTGYKKKRFAPSIRPEPVGVDAVVRDLDPALLDEMGGQQPPPYLVAVAEHADVSMPGRPVEVSIGKEGRAVVQPKPAAEKHPPGLSVVRDLERGEANAGRWDGGARRQKVAKAFAHHHQGIVLIQVEALRDHGQPRPSHVLDGAAN